MFWAVCVTPHEVLVFSDQSLEGLLEKLETEIKQDDRNIFHFFKGEKLDIQRQTAVCYSEINPDGSLTKHYVYKSKEAQNSELS